MRYVVIIIIIIINLFFIPSVVKIPRVKSEFKTAAADIIVVMMF